MLRAPSRPRNPILWGGGPATCVQHDAEDHGPRKLRGGGGGGRVLPTAALINSHLAVTSDLQKSSSHILEHGQLSRGRHSILKTPNKAKQSSLLIPWLFPERTSGGFHPRPLREEPAEAGLQSRGNLAAQHGPENPPLLTGCPALILCSDPAHTLPVAAAAV